MLTINAWLAGTGLMVWVLAALWMFFFGLEAAWLALRSIGKADAAAVSNEIAVWPRVTVQLPVFNERSVIPRLLDAVARLDYPIGLLEVQVLDDSTDDTPSIVAGELARLQQSGIRFFHIRRPDRSGFKGGALAQGMQSATGSVFAIFDADFLPTPDFLRKTIPVLLQNHTAAVQGMWQYINPHASVFTRLQALALGAHFHVEQFARSRAGYWMNFNGSGGIWRREAIEEAGGWSGATITEDLDLSIRVQSCGWRIRFMPDAGILCELPEEVGAIRNQQFRWTRGGAQTAVRTGLDLLCSKASPGMKWHAHLLLYGHVGFLMVMLAGLAGIVLTWFPALGWEKVISGAALLMAISSLLLFFFYLIGLVHQQELKLDRWPMVFLIPMLMIWMAGLSLQNTKAVVGGWLGRSSVFIRTPKGNGYRPASPAGIGIPEILLGFVFAAHAWMAGTSSTFFGLLFMLAVGLISIGVITLVSNFSSKRDSLQDA